MSPPTGNLRRPLPRDLSLRLVRAARAPADRRDMVLGDLLDTLGDRSLGWCLLLFSLINLPPTPIGTNMITSIPVLIVTAQMALGAERVHLPAFVTRRGVHRRRFRRLVLWLGPAIRPVERMVRPRHLYVFSPGAQRALGSLFLLVAMAIFAPIPFTSYFPAAALCLAGIGLVERDGLVTLAGVALGIVAILVTVVLGAMLVLGVGALAG